VDAELRVHPLQVLLHRVLADRRGLGDRAVREAADDELDDLLLAWRQPRQRGGERGRCLVDEGREYLRRAAHRLRAHGECGARALRPRRPRAPARAVALLRHDDDRLGGDPTSSRGDRGGVPPQRGAERGGGAGTQVRCEQPVGGPVGVEERAVGRVREQGHAERVEQLLGRRAAPLERVDPAGARVGDRDVAGDVAQARHLGPAERGRAERARHVQRPDEAPLDDERRLDEVVDVAVPEDLVERLRPPGLFAPCEIAGHRLVRRRDAAEDGVERPAPGLVLAEERVADAAGLHLERCQAVAVEFVDAVCAGRQQPLRGVHERALYLPQGQAPVELEHELLERVPPARSPGHLGSIPDRHPSRAVTVARTRSWRAAGHRVGRNRCVSPQLPVVSGSEVIRALSALARKFADVFGQAAWAAGSSRRWASRWRSARVKFHSNGVAICS